MSENQKRYKSSIRKKQIINAARKLVVNHGSENVTINKLAKEVKISEGAIYRHFKNKRDILLGLVDTIKHDWQFEMMTEKNANSSPISVLDRVLNNHLSAIEQRRGVTFQVIAEIVSLGDRRLNKKINLIIDGYLNSLKALIVEAIKAGEIRNNIDVDAAAILIFGMIQGLVNIWALSNYNFNLLHKFQEVWQFQRALITQDGMRVRE